jgi:membrane protein involved in colicin uptake
MVNVEMTNAPNLESVPNVEMTNAVVNNARNANNLARNEAVRRSRAEAVLAKEELKAKKAKEAANKANANARKAAVERSKAEAAATRAAKKAEREGSSSSNTANNAARKAANNAAKKANANAKKAAANAEKLAANAKKLAANAIVKNVENKLKVIQNGPGSKENKNKMGRSIYLKATKKVHPNSGGNQVSFVKLGNIYNKFKNFTGTKVTAGFNETWTA